MILFYQLRNKVQVYTNLLKYLLCFTTPANEKLGPEKHSNYYIVRKQKHCNFCGFLLSQPDKVTLAHKCG